MLHNSRPLITTDASTRRPSARNMPLERHEFNEDSKKNQLEDNNNNSEETFYGPGIDDDI